MSIQPNRGSYLYHGSAFGFGAQFTHPTKSTIPTQAVAIVPPSGGESFACVKDYDYNCIVTFDEATAYAAGTEDPDGSHNTLASVTIRNFNFLNMVHAELIVMRITTKHPPSRGKAGDPLPEAEISFRGSHVQGLYVGGARPALNFDTALFDECVTFDRLRARTDDKRCFSHVKGGDPTVIHTSLTGNPDPIEIPDFGRIFIGEVIAQRGYRRVNMLRFDLGCSVGGSGTAGGGEGNGTDIPPAPTPA
jgi:hypothetical protein